MKRTLLVFLVGLAGCPGFTKDVPQAPTYNECTPSHSFDADLAASTEDMSVAGDFSSDPTEAKAQAEKILEELDIEIIPKAEGIEDWGRFTTTFPDKLYLSTNYPSMSVDSQAGLLRHELVHVREYQRHGVSKFFTMYAFAEGRWALEVQAYRESFRARRLFGEDERSIQEAMRGTAENLYKSYSLDLMPKECAIEGAIEIWMEDAR